MKYLNARRAIALTTIITLLTVGAAAADNIDITPGTTDLLPGASTTFTVALIATTGAPDAVDGCNASTGGSNSVKVAFTTSNDSRMVAPAHATLTGCDDPGTSTIENGATITVTALTTASEGEVTLTAGPHGSNEGIRVVVSEGPPQVRSYGTFTSDTITFTILPSDSTPPIITPTVSGTLGSNGWYTSNVTVTWSATDTESAISSSNGCGSTTISADTAGTSLTCSATSAGGPSSQSVTIKRDATAPTISGTASPEPNGAGWNNTDVTVDFTCGDNLSGVVSCGPNATVDEDGPDQSVSGTAVDAAGNSASATVSSISVDKTAPTISGSASPAANSAGWNNTDVTVSFTCGDGLSGIASCGPEHTLSSEGTNQSVTGTATDNAGNSATASVTGIKIDKTAPTSVVSGVENGKVYVIAPDVSCVTSDALSLVATPASLSGAATTPGPKTVSCDGAIDNAGNSQTTPSPSVSYTVAPIAGFNTNFDGSAVLKVKPNQAIPLKWSFNDGTANLPLLTSATIVSQESKTCSVGAELQGSEVAEVAAGSSGLQLLPDGSYQMNWKATSTIGCRAVTVKMALTGGGEHVRTIYVDIKK